jgi:hypothetical protein
MSHWISVYCQKRITNFSASLLEQAIRHGCTDHQGCDYFDTLFEFVKVREHLVKKKGHEASVYHLTYKTKNATDETAAGDGKIPIVLDRIIDAEQVRKMVQEQLEEYLKNRRGAKAALVREHLAKITEIYSFCLKQSHCDGAGNMVVAIARAFLAEKGKGMVREDGVGWLKWTHLGLFEALKE